MLAETAYGKSSVRLVKVSRHGDRHDLKDLTVSIRFEGEYDQSYTDGDNREVLPTDTMKNTVYALAATNSVGEPEVFGRVLAEHFLERNPVQTLVLYGPDDHVIWPDFPRRAEVAFPDRVGPFVVPGAGHFLQWERAELLNGVLVAFLRDLL